MERGETADGYRKPKKDEDKYEYPYFAEKLKKNKYLFIHHEITN